MKFNLLLFKNLPDTIMEAFNGSTKSAKVTILPSLDSDTAHQRRDESNIFSRVYLFTRGEVVPCDHYTCCIEKPPLDVFKLVKPGSHCKGTHTTPSPMAWPSHCPQSQPHCTGASPALALWTCSNLFITKQYSWQVGSWHPTGMLSCYPLNAVSLHVWLSRY